MSSGPSWPKEHEEIIRQRYGDCDTSELEKIFGRSREAIRNKANSMGITKTAAFWKKFGGGPSEGWDTDDSGPKRKFLVLGKTEIIPPLPGLLAHLMSMSGSMGASNIYQVAKVRSEGTKERWSKIKRMLDSGMNACQIADETGIPRGTVYWYIKKMKAAA